MNLFGVVCICSGLFADVRICSTIIGFEKKRASRSSKKIEIIHLDCVLFSSDYNFFENRIHECGNTAV